MDIHDLAPWFHNVVLPDGKMTCPSRPNYPQELWNDIQPFLTDFNGKDILDIGCNGGYMILEAERRGCNVTAYDSEDLYVNQSRFIKDAFGLKAEIFKHDCHVPLDRKFDVVLMLGVIYHVENPILAIRSALSMTKDYLLIETAIAPGNESFAYFMLDTPHIDKWRPTVKCVHKIIERCGASITDHYPRAGGHRYTFKVKPV